MDSTHQFLKPENTIVSRSGTSFLQLGADVEANDSARTINNQKPGYNPILNPNQRRASVASGQGQIISTASDSFARKPAPPINGGPKRSDSFARSGRRLSESGASPGLGESGASHGSVLDRSHLDNY